MSENFTPAASAAPQAEFAATGGELEEAEDPTPEMERALQAATEQADREAEEAEGDEAVEGEVAEEGARETLEDDIPTVE